MDNFLETCPICYNAYSEPKGLPCFHTFCRECLQIHINNSSVDGLYFYCPMCRKRTEPFCEKSTPVSEWAKSFPTNNYILNRYLEVSQKQCPAHSNEILDISCKTCRLMICCQCCMSTHEKCDKTMTVFNAKKIKDHLHTRLQNLKLKLEPLEKRQNKLQEDRDHTVSQLQTISEELLDYVRKQEKYWINEIETAYSKESSSLQEQSDNLIQIIQMTEENINELDNLVGEDGIEKGLKSQNTFDYQPKHALMEAAMDIIQSNETEMNFQISEKFLSLKDKLLNKNMINDDDDDDDDSASMEVGDMSSERGTWRLLKEVHLTPETYIGINDFVMLPDQSFLITEGYYKKIWRFSYDGESLQELNFPSEPYGLCLLQDNLIAISQPYDRKVTIFDRGMLIEKETFSFGKRYYGIGSDDNSRIYALYRNENMCVDIISKSNPQSPYNISHVIDLPNAVYFCDDYRLRVMPSGNFLIMNSSESFSIYCVDQNGSVVFRYISDDNNRFSSLSDIALGTDCIYASDKNSHNIHRIQYQGNFMDIPLTANNGVYEPRKIFVNNEGVLAVFSRENHDFKIQLFSN